MHTILSDAIANGSWKRLGCCKVVDVIVGSQQWKIAMVGLRLKMVEVKWSKCHWENALIVRRRTREDEGEHAGGNVCGGGGGGRGEMLVAGIDNGRVVKLLGRVDSWKRE